MVPHLPPACAPAGCLLWVCVRVRLTNCCVYFPGLPPTPGGGVFPFHTSCHRLLPPLRLGRIIQQWISPIYIGRLDPSNTDVPSPFTLAICQLFFALAAAPCCSLFVFGWTWTSLRRVFEWFSHSEFFRASSPFSSPVSATTHYQNMLSTSYFAPPIQLFCTAFDHTMKSIEKYNMPWDWFCYIFLYLRFTAVTISIKIENFFPYSYISSSDRQ